MRNVFNHIRPRCNGLNQLITEWESNHHHYKERKKRKNIGIKKKSQKSAPKGFVVTKESNGHDED